jgi:hypothetical protein
MLSAPPHPKRWLAAIVLLGAALRLFPIWFGLPFPYARPDENEAIGHAFGILAGDPNPHFFHWPSLTFYLFAAVFAAVAPIHKALSGDLMLTHDAAALAARAVVAIAGTLTILPLHRLARRMFDETSALTAAFFLAVAVLHVRDSHFAMTDVLMTLFVVLCLARLAAAYDGAPLSPAEERPTYLGGFAVAGVLGGLAASTKYSAAAVVGAMAVAQLFLLARFRRAPWSLPAWAPAVVFVAAAAAGFLAGTPFAVLDAPAFTADFLYDFTHLSSGHGVDVGSGWRAHLTRSLPYGCGPLLFFAGVVGWFLALRRAPHHTAIVTGFAAAFLVALGSGRTVFFRYVMPLVPITCLFAAVAARSLAATIAGVLPVAPRAAALAAALLIGGLSLASSVWMDLLLARTDTRVVAARWLTAQLRSPHSLHDAGGAYVHLDLREADYHQWFFNPRTQSFGDPNGRTPDWIVIAESPLQLYAQPDPSVKRLATERYAPVLVVRGTRSLDSAAVYDQQDAFFLPFSRFWEVERPGPTITVYRRRD